MKILMVGLGAIGQRHVRNLVSLLGPELELIAYRTRNLPTVLTDRMQVDPAGGDVNSRYHIRAFSNLDEALAQGPEAAFICNPSSLHVPVAMAAAQAGCHLFVEKPLSHTLEGIETLADTLDAHQRIALVGYQMRFHPCLQRLYAMLASGAIGRILSVRAEVGEYLPNWHPFEDYRQSYAARQDLGGGTLLSQIHEMDYLYWLFGLPQRIFALGGHLSHLEVDVEDVTSTMMECQVDGQLIPVHLHQDFVQRPPSRTCQIVGDDGKIEMDLNALSIRRFDYQGQMAEEVSFPGFQRNQLFISELEHFFACMRGEQQPLVSLRDGAQSLRMALAAQESLRSGQVVTLC